MVQLAPDRGQATNYRLESGLRAIWQDPPGDLPVIGLYRTCKRSILAENRFPGFDLDGLWTQDGL